MSQADTIRNYVLKNYLELARVTLVSRKGPKQSSTVEWVFAVQ
jgi:hypothetical protein